MPARNEITAAPTGAESSTLYVAIEISRKSWVVGGAITTPSAHTAAWDTGRRRRKRSFRQAGRPAPLRRPSSLAEKPSMH